MAMTVTEITLQNIMSEAARRLEGTVELYTSEKECQPAILHAAGTAIHLLRECAAEIERVRGHV